VDRARESVETLAIVLAQETGKPIADARGEVDGALGLLDYYATIAGGSLDPQANEAGTLLRRPYGVAAVIVPWNYPIVVGLRSIVPALLAGNTVIWKPSEKTPLASVHLVQALLGDSGESRSPLAGVLNIVTGDASTGRLLVEDPRVRLVVHTGSTAAGRAIATVAGAQLKTAVLELGGKDAVIVDSDVDPREAAQHVAQGCFENAGQICTSIERVLVSRTIAEQFVTELTLAARDWNTDPERMGPLIDAGQRDHVSRQVSDAETAGATALVGGHVPDGPGFHYPATVVVDVDQTLSLFRDETFGPVAPVVVFDDFDEAIELVNDSHYGLACTVLTADPARRAAAMGRLDVGIAWLNQWHGSVAGGRFEAAKDSGLGSMGPGASLLEAVTRPQQLVGVLPDQLDGEPIRD
jgi:acyl-CoA reductase-like NAD-dependent aldehyde dehydrogenase